MKRSVLYILLIISILSAKDQIIYLSPGVGFNWNLRGHITVEPKLSMGYWIEDGFFTNLTIGYKYPVTIYDNEKIHAQYFQVQAGIIDDEISKDFPLVTGGGFGMIYYKDNKNTYGTTLSIFSGCIGLIKADYEYTNTYKGNFNLGFMGVLPIPLFIKGLNY